MNKTIHLIAIIGIILIAYSNSLRNGFALDDGSLIVDNTSLHGISMKNIKEVFSSATNGLEYLPVRDLTYCIDYEIWGLNPFGYHLSNLIYYIVVCILIYFFLLGVITVPKFRDSSHMAIAFLSTAVFAVHPVHVEVVSGISQRKDLVSGIFFFLSLYGFILYKDKGRLLFYSGSIAMFALSLLSKSTVVFLPLTIFLIDSLTYAEEGIQRKLIRVMPYLFIGAIISLVEIMVLKETGVFKTEYSFGSGYEFRVYSSFRAVFYYLKLLFVPYPLDVFQRFSISRSLFELKVIFSIIGVAVMLYLIYLVRKARPVLSFSGAWFMISIIPAIGLIPTGIVIAERYLFLPSLGFCLAIGLLIQKGIEMQKTLRWGLPIAFGLIISGFMFISYNRNFDWKDNETLFLSSVRVSPDRASAHFRLGREYFYMARYEEAFRSLAVAEEMDPLYGINYRVFEALRAIELNNPNEALRLLGEITHPKKEDIFEVNYLYGKSYEAMGDYEKAQKSYNQALSSAIKLDALSFRKFKHAFKENSPD
ncbi:MAG: tetratricopeptide repeat protein [Nitrospirae bacterium]|nr:tetratricopeptide repeat protein [Nitrospirota bacterium]